jgi:hypothetical protein
VAVPTYDGRGNLTYDGSWKFGYDSENRWTSTDGVRKTSLAGACPGQQRSCVIRGCDWPPRAGERQRFDELLVRRR